MKKRIWRKSVSFLLAVVLTVMILPATAFAAFDSNGKPTDLKNEICLSIYNGTDFPGEPAVYGTGNYTSFNSSFKKASSWLSTPTFKSSAVDELNPQILNDLQEGAHSGSTTVWGVYDAEGMKHHFLEDASIIQPENELKIIQAIKGSSATLDQYEVVWYVIKFQTSSSLWGSKSGEWHIDGVIKERRYCAVHYYGNGNTSGSAPAGSKTINPGSSYTVLDNTGNMTKEIGGESAKFMGWNTAVDGSGTFYQPGDKIQVDADMSLYAVWELPKKYSAVVITYLDDIETAVSDLHDSAAGLSLSLDGKTYLSLEEKNTGVYSTEVSKNGAYSLYIENADGSYSPVDVAPLNINGQYGALNVRHYSVSYDCNGGAFASDKIPAVAIHHAGEQVVALSNVPEKANCDFLGWKDQNGNMIQPGSEVTASIGEKTVLTAQWKEIVHEIVANATNGGSASGGGTYGQGENVTLVAKPEDGYAFTGWYEDGDLITKETEYSFKATSARTFTAKFSKVYTVTAVAGSGGSVKGSGQYEPLSKAKLTATPNSGYFFVGWYDGSELVSSDAAFSYTVLEDKTFTAKFEVKKTYKSDYVYILGYDDAVIAAEKPLLRCEVSQMIYRLVKQNGQLGDFSYNAGKTPVFTDTEGKWFRSGIEFMDYKGAFPNKAKVYPGAQVTRGEAYKLICLGLGFTRETELNGRDYGAILYNLGYISVDEASEVKASGKITRWEFCVLFNNILGRSGAKLVTKDGTVVTAETYGYTDLSESDRYYEAIMIATSTFKDGYVDLANRRDRSDLDG